MSTIRAVFLGCGSSTGVPVIGCKCKVCKSNSPYNKRLRSAMFIYSKNASILIDAGFDLRQQLIRKNISDFDAIILTHRHADHISGLDELRVFSYENKKNYPLYGDIVTINHLYRLFKYFFINKYFTPYIVCNYPYCITVGDINVKLFRQDHGVMDSLGIRINNFVYANDVIDFYPESINFLKDLKTLVVDCRSYKSTNIHAGLDKVLQWNDMFKPEKIYLTNMNHEIDYFEIKKHLPKNIIPAHDGLSLVV